MSSLPRGSTSDQNRPLAETSRWPVLARLPHVTTDPLANRPGVETTSGATSYRFDPPQADDSAARHSTPATAVNRNATAGVRRQPHAFDRNRVASTRVNPRRESPILPRSNPFAIPRPRLIDSLAPAVRFLTMFVLFTAAGLWLQMLGRHEAAPTQSMELPKTAAQPPVAPTKNADAHTLPAPTATGPLEVAPQPPQTGARLGQADGNDFAKLEQKVVPVPMMNRPAVNPPHVLVRSGEPLPRVHTTEPQSANSSGSESGEMPSVAQLPGTFFEIPTR
jgi:hypothetical protein